MLEQLDRQVFLYLNSLHSSFFDGIMHAVSSVAIWIPLYLAILISLGFLYRRKFIVIFIFILLAVTLSDQLSVQLFKNVFHRLRPCHNPALEGLVHLVNGECGGPYGFVSSHASNCFNVAVLSLLLVRNRWYSAGMLMWAVLVSYSRIYLGVHYPGDVICGALLGTLIGWGIYSLYMYTDRHFLDKKPFFNSGKQHTV